VVEMLPFRSRLDQWLELPALVAPLPGAWFV
jgi:hypothetical protein